jgi:hypothetical protein
MVGADPTSVSMIMPLSEPVHARTKGKRTHDAMTVTPESRLAGPVQQHIQHYMVVR